MSNLGFLIWVYSSCSGCTPSMQGYSLLSLSFCINQFCLLLCILTVNCVSYENNVDLWAVDYSLMDEWWNLLVCWSHQKFWSFQISSRIALSLIQITNVYLRIEIIIMYNLQKKQKIMDQIMGNSDIHIVLKKQEGTSLSTWYIRPVVYISETLCIHQESTRPINLHSLPADLYAASSLLPANLVPKNNKTCRPWHKSRSPKTTQLICKPKTF